MKTLEKQNLMILLFWNFAFLGWRTLLNAGGQCSWRGHGSSTHHHPHPHTFPTNLPWLFLSCMYPYDKLRTLSPFMSSVSHSNKLLKLGKGSWEPPVYSWLIRSTGDSCDLQLAFRAGAVWVWALNLWGLPNSCGLVPKVEPRTPGQYAENQRTGSWCW